MPHEIPTADSDTKKSESKFIVNNPFFTYPQFPMHGYYEFDVYRKEVIRLYEFIKTLSTSTPTPTPTPTPAPEKSKPDTHTLIHLCIGAVMEEVSCEKEYSNYNHWRQLFPQWIEDYLFTNSTTVKHKNVKIIIVSPNVTFSDKTFKDPAFISKTEELFAWKKIGLKSYTSTLHNVTVDIFCTPFPHEERRRNQEHMERLSKGKEDPVICSALANIVQTDEDVKFVAEFYATLSKYFDLVTGSSSSKGKVVCSSYAVFNEDAHFRIFNVFSLFSEICTLFPKQSLNRLLCRWFFATYNTSMIVNDGSSGWKKRIDYVESNFGALFDVA